MQAQLTSGAQEVQKVSRVFYAPWLPESLLFKSGRLRVAAAMLYRAGVFPKLGDLCLEVGFGWLGWLGTLLTWGIRERDLHGLDLDAIQLNPRRELLPLAALPVRYACTLPR